MNSSIQSRRIAEVTVPRSGDRLFAAAESETHVYVCSLENRKTIRQLETVFGFGGGRLAISAVVPILVAGSWTHGLQALDYSNGGLLWHRKDLRHIQPMSDLSGPDGARFGVGLEEGPLHIIDGETGRTIMKLAGVREILPSSFGDLYLWVAKRHVALSKLNGSSPIWKQPLVSFGILEAAFSPEQVAYAEAGGSVYCMDFTGQPVWTFVPSKGVHVRALAWEPKGSRWLAVTHPFDAKGLSWELIEISQEGVSRTIYPLSDTGEALFSAGATYLITTEGVIETASSKMVWDFAKGIEVLQP